MLVKRVVNLECFYKLLDGEPWRSEILSAQTRCIKDSKRASFFLYVFPLALIAKLKSKRLVHSAYTEKLLASPSQILCGKKK